MGCQLPDVPQNGARSFDQWSNTSLYLFSATGVWASYLMYGYLQEGVTLQFREDGQHLGWFMTASQFGISAMVSAIQLSFEGFPSGKAQPQLPYAINGFGAIVSMGCSNTACLFLNYPTQVLFRSSKLIPTMVLGAIVFRQRYSFQTYLASFLIVKGLIMLALADQAISPSFDPIGLVFITVSVVAGAMIANYQEMIFKKYDPTESQLLLHMKAWGFLFLIVVCLFTGQLFEGVAYFAIRPVLLARLVTWAVVATLGELFQMLLIKRFGSLINVTTTVCRQAITVYLSFILYPKPYSHWYLVAAIFIFGGILLNLYGKNAPQFRRWGSRALLLLHSKQRTD